MLKLPVSLQVPPLELLIFCLEGGFRDQYEDLLIILYLIRVIKNHA